MGEKVWEKEQQGRVPQGLVGGRLAGSDPSGYPVGLFPGDEVVYVGRTDSGHLRFERKGRFVDLLPGNADCLEQI